MSDSRGGDNVLVVAVGGGGGGVLSERGARKVDRLARVKMSGRGEKTARLRRSEKDGD